MSYESSLWTVSPYADVIDSRDVIDRLQELADLREEAVQAMTSIDLPEEGISWGEVSDLSNAAFDAVFTEDDEAEEAALLKLQEQAERYAEEDWQYGVTLIRDSYFEDYARDFAEEIGAIPNEYTWPTSCIDWEQAARELQYDYTAVDFDGVTYWVR